MPAILDKLCSQKNIRCRKDEDPKFQRHQRNHINGRMRCNLIKVFSSEERLSHLLEKPTGQHFLHCWEIYFVGVSRDD